MADATIEPWLADLLQEPTDDDTVEPTPKRRRIIGKQPSPAV